MNGSLTSEPDSFSDEAWSLLLIAEQSARRWRHQNLDVEHLIQVLFRNKKFQNYCSIKNYRVKNFLIGKIKFLIFFLFMFFIFFFF